MNKQVLFLTLFIIISILFMPIFGRAFLIPFYYFPIYAFLLYKIFINPSKIFIINKYIFTTSAIFLLACFYSCNAITNIISFVKYTFMWLLNLYLASHISLNDTKRIFFRSSTISSIFIICLFPLYHILGFLPDEFFNSFGFNVNQLCFFVIFSIFYLLSISKFKFSKILTIVPILYLKSRMLILQSIALLFFKSKYKKLIIFSIFILLITFSLKFPIFDFFYEIYNVLLFSNFELSKSFEDSRRLTLLISGIKVIQNLFPFGTGLGLENFTFYSDLYLSDVDNFRSSMTHNFYLSYTGIFGLMFIPFVISLIFPLFSIKNSFRNFVFVMFIGIAFNEYITSPYFWVAYGTFLQKNSYYEI